MKHFLLLKQSKRQTVQKKCFQYLWWQRRSTRSRSDWNPFCPHETEVRLQVLLDRVMKKFCQLHCRLTSVMLRVVGLL